MPYELVLQQKQCWCLLKLLKIDATILTAAKALFWCPARTAQFRQSSQRQAANSLPEQRPEQIEALAD